MRTPDPGSRYINFEHLVSTKILTTNDIQEDNLWQLAPVAVTSNKERVLMNNLQSKCWALQDKTPRFIWEIPLVRDLESSISTTIHQHIYKSNPALMGCFVAGAPGNLIIES
jgi:hypothetical protein